MWNKNRTDGFESLGTIEVLWSDNQRHPKILHCAIYTCMHAQTREIFPPQTTTIQWGEEEEDMQRDELQRRKYLACGNFRLLQQLLLASEEQQTLHVAQALALYSPNLGLS